MSRPDLGDRVVVITGASGGIGRATAQLLAGRGSRLVLAARASASLLAVEQECRDGGATGTLVVETDVLDEQAVDDLLAAAVRRFGRVDAWVHTAATVAYGRFEELPSEVFRRVVDTGIHGSANVTRAALRQFRAQGSGTLVLTGSLLGEIVTPYMSSYVTSKWAVRGFARTVQIETRDLPDVHVCVVSPGGVDTPIYRQAANVAGRIGRPPPPVDRPEKVARAIVRSLQHPKPRRSVGPANGVTRLGFTLLPGVFDAAVGPLMRRGGLSRDRVEPHDGNVFAPQPEADALHGEWGRHWLRAVPVAVGLAAAGAGAVRRRNRSG